LNKRSFLELEIDEKQHRFYRTGDLVRIDEEGDIMYLRRIDDQVQVQGYRVELGEIEAYARSFMKGLNVGAIGKDTVPGDMKLYLFVESGKSDFGPLYEYLKKQLPPYMIPSEIIAIRELPKLVSGKLNRKTLTRFIPL